jgi:hypothetical protein
MVFLVPVVLNFMEAEMDEEPIKFRIFRRQDGEFTGPRQRKVHFTGCNGNRHVSYVDLATFDEDGLATATSVQSHAVVGACDHSCASADLGNFLYVTR